MKGIGAGIGLIGLLMGVGIMFYLSFGGGTNPGTVRPALEAKRETKELVNAVSGRDANSVPVTDSITFTLEPKGVRVKTVDPQGALAKQFGLIPGDLITEIGPLAADQFATSESDAKAFMQAQYARPDAWTVVRGTQRIKLPEQRNVGLESVATPPAVPTTPETNVESNPPANEPRTNPRNQARDLMKKIESH
jgi:hypothetical protein